MGIARHASSILLAAAMAWPAAGAETAPARPEAAPGVERAVDAVYPALVQIWALSLDHDDGRERKYETSGSGAIISADGHVVTNYHVAGKTVDLRCVLATREELRATIVGADPLSDIAVIKLDLSGRPAGARLPVARFTSSATLKVGDRVLAMGCPLSISQSVTLGIVSNVGMTLPRYLAGRFTLEGEDVGSVVKWIAHDATIFPGNSGGPLVNLAGEIVGINEISYGLGGAIPSDVAREVCDQLIASGRVKRAWIGAGFQPLLKSAHAEGAADASVGVLVSTVVPGSPAERAGLKPGDTVTALDGEPVRVRFADELPPLVQRLLSRPVDKPIALTVVGADGASRPVSIVPEDRDEARAKQREAKEWGVTARRLTVMEAKERQRPDTRGVLIGSVRPGASANAAVPDLRQGDIVLEVGGKPVDDLDAFMATTAAIVKDAKEPVPTLVRFARKGEIQLTVVEIGVRPPPEPPAPARRAWLPVSTQVLSPKLAAALGLKGRKGVRVTEVYPGGSAERAGFRVGDIVTHVGDQLVEASAPQDEQLFESLVRQYKPDAEVEFTLIRDGQPTKVAMTLEGAPRQQAEMKVHDAVTLEFKARDIAYLDRVRQRWPADLRGAVVSEVASGGWAAVAGLHADDLIMAVGGEAIVDVPQLAVALERAEKARQRQIVLFVRRGIATTFIEIQPAWSRAGAPTFTPPPAPTPAPGAATP